MLPNIFICTLIMWGLSSIAVTPLAKRWFTNALVANPALATIGNPESISNDMHPEIQKLYNINFIKADVFVMGVAGFIAGLAGFPLIGFAWKANAWPGMIAMIGLSFLGFHLTGGPR